MTLYNLKGGPEVFRITKFDSDLNPETSYNVSDFACDCPAGVRPTCRHRKMLPVLAPYANTAWFYNFEQSRFEDPTGEADAAQRAESDAEAERLIERLREEDPHEALAAAFGEPILETGDGTIYAGGGKPPQDGGQASPEPERAPAPKTGLRRL